MPAEALLFYSLQDDPIAWQAALQAALPDLEIRIWPDIGNPTDIRYALVWKPPPNFFTPLTNLRLVVNLGAGVDTLLSRNDLPNVPITRLYDPNMARMMSSFVQMAVIRHARNIHTFQRAQRQARWTYIHPTAPEETTVAVLGLGVLGAQTAQDLARHGYRTLGWSRSPKSIPTIESHHGPTTLDTVLSQANILVVMLPLTPTTTNLLTAPRLSHLPKGAALINVARGPIINEPALITALQSGAIAEATLDVFTEEPLAAGSPLWEMDQVLITPHLASIALPGSAAAEIAADIRRLRGGEPVLRRVDAATGY